MDIQIVGVDDPGDGFLYVLRRIDGASIPSPNRMPKEMLGMRAAEYDLDVRDPMALDIMLLEPFMEVQYMQHPLYACDTIAEALEIVWGCVEDVRVKHGAPEEPMMRSLFHAADLEESTQGLTDTKAALLYHAPDDIGTWIRMNRDATRKRVSVQKERGLLTVTDVLKREALAPVIAQAHDENYVRMEAEADRASRKTAARRT